jgi:hypothetical protein
VGDLAGVQPVVVLSDLEHTSAPASTLDVLDCRQNGILLRFGFAIEEAQHGAVPLSRERAIVAASLKENV